MAALRIIPAPVLGAPGLAVRGEIDMATAQELSDAIDAAVRTSVGAFVLDLCGVEFLDSSGINVLMRARSRLGREDRSLVLVCAPGSVRRVLAEIGIERLFAVFDSRDAVADALVPADRGRRDERGRADAARRGEAQSRPARVA